LLKNELEFINEIETLDSENVKHEFSAALGALVWNGDTEHIDVLKEFVSSYVPKDELDEIESDAWEDL
jgi:hypothetical protein